MLLHQCLNLFEKSGLITYNLADNSRENRIIGEITNSNNSINPTIYDSYSSNFRKAVDSVFRDSKNELSDKLKANVSRFAAYKSMHATRQIRSTITDTGSIDDAKKILHKFNRWQAAEYNTTVARSRTAKQWQEFASEVNLVLFPNLRWIPSRSATPREEHVVFWNKVWAKTDPFWTQNQPGSLWNCGCDWEETDAPVSGMSYHKSLSAKGLEGNPAITGEIFTNNSSYVKLANKEKAEVEEFFKPIKDGQQEYIKYRDNPDYENVKLNWNNGGVMATHKKHNFDKKRGRYEKEVQEIGYKNGNVVVLESEESHTDYQKKIEGLWNGLTFEMGTSLGTGFNNIKAILNHARRKNADIAVIYFPDENLYSYKRLKKGVKLYNGQTEYRFRKIIYIVNGVIYVYK